MILASDIPKGIYRHYKGNDYLVLGTARHSETEQVHVIYRALYEEHGLWIRPLDMFMELVEHQGKQVNRFQLVNPQSKE